MQIGEQMSIYVQIYTSLNMHDAWFANDESTHTSKTVMLAYTIRKFHPCTSLVLLLVSILIFLDVYSAHLALTCGRMSNLKNLHNSMAYCITQWRKVDKFAEENLA